MKVDFFYQDRTQFITSSRIFGEHFKGHTYEKLAILFMKYKLRYLYRAASPCMRGNHSFRGTQRTPIHAEHVALAPRGRIIDEGGRERSTGCGQEVEDERGGRRLFAASKRGSTVLENSMFLGGKKRRRRAKTIYHVGFGAAPCSETSLGEARTRHGRILETGD
ncbi:hypothetical protein DBV15_05852 [Temnothorax longispinosus]|uniref:Uncharacterized protein n=1 Tax=Temnothorax longispinosus TaxID=300112 RepID=A0A4S2JQQ2_9HYME|nr:hypothetical protein DBV15_05852 [Temnothorax longispinosus]